MIVSQRRKRRIALLLVACMIIAAAVGYKLWSVRTPLARATRVIIEIPEDTGTEFGSFSWMPSDRLLGFYGSRNNWYSYILDIRTGQKQRLEPLYRLVLAQHSWLPFGVNCQASPNGKWLLWGSDIRSPSEFFVAALDCSQVIAWRKQPQHNHHGQRLCLVAWRADSRAWFLFFTDSHKSRYGNLDHIRIYFLDTPRTQQTISLKGLQIKPDQVFCLPDNRILAYEQSRRQLSIFALDAPAATLRQYTVKPDVGGEGINDYIQILLSPQGDQLAWCIAQPLHEPRPIIDKFMGKYMKVRLRVSQIDGSDMRELGSFSATLLDHGGDIFSYYAWSADGKRLLLRRNEDFWWVPVDP